MVFKIVEPRKPPFGRYDIGANAIEELICETRGELEKIGRRIVDRELPAEDAAKLRALIGQADKVLEDVLRQTANKTAPSGKKP